MAAAAVAALKGVKGLAEVMTWLDEAEEEGSEDESEEESD